MLRPIAVQRYLAVMQARGMPTDCILAGSGIDEAKLGRSDFLAESWQCRVVVDNLLRVSGDNGIGFDVGLNTTLLDLGIVGHAAITCRTMRETHRLWEQYGMALSGVMGLLKIIQERRDRVTLAFANQSMSDSLLRFYAEETLGMLHMIGNPLVGELPAVMEATFAYRAPQHAHRYRELLQCPIHFDSGVSTITIDRRWFEKNVRTYDAEFNKLCWNHCGEVLHRIESEQAIVARLRGIFMNYVGSTPQRRLHASSASARVPCAVVCSKSARPTARRSTPTAWSRRRRI